MSKRRSTTASGPTRRKPTRLNRSECGKTDRRPNPESGRSDHTAALTGSFTPDITCAGQRHAHGSALRDEDLHSFHGTALGAAPNLHHDGGARGAGQSCACGSILPLPRLLPPVSRSDLFCTVTPIDDRGRLADRSPIRAAGWAPGQPVTISTTDDHDLVIVRAGGPETITRHGHLRLPARIRHSCGLSAGDRLLVAVTATPSMLTVYPMATVEAILRHRAPGSTSAGTP